jgi:hypothetical protein
MSVIGSVFLGDRSHHLPKLHAASLASASPSASLSPKAVKVDPVLALQLRIRWLEALVYGFSIDSDLGDDKRALPAISDSVKGKTLVEGVEQLKKGLEEEVMKREEFRKFYKNC